jgi:hypothetical protein
MDKLDEDRFRLPHAPIENWAQWRKHQGCAAAPLEGTMEGLKSLARDTRPYPKSKDLVVFSILRESKCTDCDESLGKGRYLFVEAGRPLCLRCADLDHLIYLPAGDAAVTRRAKKYSSLSAVVARFSRSRGRYERQGVLVEETALHHAEEECLADADKRATRRAREEMRRMEQDHELAAHMADRILNLFPGCPLPEARAIATHTGARSSGRVGRTAAGKALAPDAITARRDRGHSPQSHVLRRAFDERL